MEDYYTTDQVAQYCKVSRSSVIRWIHEGKLTAAVTAGGHHRIMRADLVKLLESLRLPLPQKPRQGKPVALIVEDEESVRRMLHFFIQENFPEFQVEESEDGFDAGMKIQKFQPDLVLLDLRLPGQDGFVICKQIRDIPQFSQTIIIVITGVADSLVRESMMFFGANDYMVKPFNLDSLKAKIQHHMKLRQTNLENDPDIHAA
jgi:excisionase family DNA binding protein